MTTDAEDRESQDVIWKLSIPIIAPGSVLHEVPKTARFVSVGWDPAYPEGMAAAVWFRVARPRRSYTGPIYKDEWELNIVGTGHPFPFTARVLGTITQGGYAWHILDLRGNVVR